MKKLTKDEAISAAQRFAPHAKRSFPGSAIYLFGSYAKGCATAGSDIDVAVVIDNWPAGMSVKQAYELECELWVSAADIADGRIEPVVVRTDNKTGFLSSILATGIRVA